MPMLQMRQMGKLRLGDFPEVTHLVIGERARRPCQESQHPLLGLGGEQQWDYPGLGWMDKGD